MTSLPDNILHLPEYHVLGTKMEEHDLHYQVEAPEPLACEECGVESEFVRFGKMWPIATYPSTESGSPSGWSVAATPAGRVEGRSGQLFRKW